MEKDKLEQLVNASGFPFQLRVAEEVRRTAAQHNWRVTSREHAWLEEPAGKEHFLDLILQRGSDYLAVECKRLRTDPWIFLVPEPATEQQGVRAYWVGKTMTGHLLRSWWDFFGMPASLQAEFCVVSKKGEQDHHQLTPQLTQVETLGRLVTRAAESVGNLLLGINALEPGGRATIVPVVVTTAKLCTCSVQAGAGISLSTGTLAKPANFAETPYIRFRKSFTQRTTTPYAKLRSIADVDKDRERTVLVVNSEHLVELLTKWDLNYMLDPMAKLTEQ